MKTYCQNAKRINILTIHLLNKYLDAVPRRVSGIQSRLCPGITMQTSRQLISVTDDDPAVLDGMQLILERAGYDTRVQSSARELMAPGAQNPALYVIDKQLIGVDGLDTCRFLKAQLSTAHIPVIIVSASPHAGALARSAGADGFLEKPFRSAELVALIARCLSGTT